MERVLVLPPAFGRFKAMGGVLDFAVFRDADGTEEDILAAVPEALYGYAYDREKLRSLGSRRITERTFFGGCYDYERGSLLMGDASWTTTDGQFAYAFLHPPYGLFPKPQPDEVQAVFEEIRNLILPPGQSREIADWSNDRLPEVSDYFEAGMEWWGVYLFSIYVPSLRRLTIIAGSSTD